MDVTKVDASTIQVTKTETATSVRAYDYGFLTQQREAIQQQKDRDNLARDAELAEVDALLLAADKLGVTALPSAPIPLLDQGAVIK